MKLISAFFSALFLSVFATAATAESPQPTEQHEMIEEPGVPFSAASEQAWTLLINVFGHKSGGPAEMPNLNRRVCGLIMDQVNRKDVRRIRYAIGDDTALRSIKALACINRLTGEIIWP